MRPIVRAWRAPLLAVVLVAGVAASWACTGDDPTAPVCTDIPQGGCPSSFGPACDDPSCTAVYTCSSPGHWSLVTTCPARESGADASVPDAPHDAPALRDVQIDVPGANGGPGCQDLEPPDCPLGLAIACPSGCCGCEDLFVCSGGAWSDWGTCDDAGAIVQSR